jgi:hypothetical protein
MYEYERQKMEIMPVEGNADLAEYMRDLLGWKRSSVRPFLSARAAQEKTGVSYTTILGLAKGLKSKPDTLSKVAKGLGGDRLKLYRLCGIDIDDDRPDYGEIPNEFKQIIDYYKIAPDNIQKQFIVIASTLLGVPGNNELTASEKASDIKPISGTGPQY